MLSTKRWQRVTYELPGGDGDFSFEVRSLSWTQAAQFKETFVPVLEAVSVRAEKLNAMKAEIDTVPEDAPVNVQQGAIAKFNAALAKASVELAGQIPKELAAQAFKDWVRKVQGIEVDGDPITTGEELYEIADERLVVHVLQLVNGHASLSADEGKALPSPSTSPEAATGDGD